METCLIRNHTLYFSQSAKWSETNKLFSKRIRTSYLWGEKHYLYCTNSCFVFRKVL